MKIPKKTTVATMAALVLLVVIGLAAYRVVYDLTTFSAEKDLSPAIHAIEKMGAKRLCTQKDGIGSGTGNLNLPEETIYFKVNKAATLVNSQLWADMAANGYTVQKDTSLLKLAADETKPAYQFIATHQQLHTEASLRLYENIGVNSNCTLVKPSSTIILPLAEPAQPTTTIYLYGQHLQ